jgi:hypothetical protein
VLDATGVDKAAPRCRRRAARAVGAQVARHIDGAQLVEVDSDHYLTLREPELVTKLLEEFLVIASIRASSSY